MQEKEKTVMLFVIDNNNVLLFRRINTWYGNNQFAPPGGLVNTNENIITAAVRETFEETGITVIEDDVSIVKQAESQANGRHFESYYCVAKKYSGTLTNKETDQHTELDWYPMNDLPDDTMPLVKDILLEL